MDLTAAYPRGLKKAAAAARTAPSVKSRVDAIMGSMPQSNDDEDNFTARYRAPAPAVEAFSAPTGWGNDNLQDRLERSIAELQRRSTSPVGTNDIILYTITGLIGLFAIDSFVNLGRKLGRHSSRRR